MMFVSSFEWRMYYSWKQVFAQNSPSQIDGSGDWLFQELFGKFPDKIKKCTNSSTSIH